MEKESFFTVISAVTMGGPCIHVYHEEGSCVVVEMIEAYLISVYGNCLDSFSMAGPWQEDYHIWKDCDAEMAVRLLVERSQVPIAGALPFYYVKL